MIRKVHRSEIAIEKYTQCLNESCQNSDFVQVDFLDLVTDKNWFLLVYKDYQAVMPIFFTRKWGIKIILMPMYSLYFGIFSKIDDAEINQLFLDELLKMAVVYYAFNPENKFRNPVSERVSYRIPSQNYENVHKGYSKSRKRNVKMAARERPLLSITESSSPKDWNSFLLQHGKNSFSKAGKKRYLDLAQTLFDAEKCHTITISYNDVPQSFALFLKGKSTWYLSLFVNNSNLTNKSIPSILIDQILHKQCEKVNFDFFGSSIPKVADFNERFGAKRYSYPVIQQGSKQIVRKLLARLFRF